jgi:hypothetical protein
VISGTIAAENFMGAATICISVSWLSEAIKGSLIFKKLQEVVPSVNLRMLYTRAHFCSALSDW